MNSETPSQRLARIVAELKETPKMMKEYGAMPKTLEQFYVAVMTLSGYQREIEAVESIIRRDCKDYD